MNNTLNYRSGPSANDRRVRDRGIERVIWWLALVVAFVVISLTILLCAMIGSPP